MKQPPAKSCVNDCGLRSVCSPRPMLSTAPAKLLIDSWRMKPATFFRKLGIFQGDPSKGTAIKNVNYCLTLLHLM